MKKILAFFLAAVFLLPVFSCSPSGGGEGFAITDSEGNTVKLKSDARVVCLYGSFAECWVDSGGTLVGVTSDAFSENRIEKSEDIAVVGTVKEPNLELITALRPDYVILSADLAAHTKLKGALSELSLPCGYFRVDTFDDYASVMERLCCVTKREDLYVKSVTEVKERIDNVLTKLPDDDRTVLLMRVYSSGIKAKGQDNLAGLILHEYGLTNIADSHPSLLEDMSLEHIVATDPDIIFVLTMGNEEAALQYLETEIESNPAFGGLTAVANQNYYVLPKELFHYKPNERWNESYEYLAKILYPKVFG
jgi:iron complex transport system substrate-binding protein